MRRRKAFPTLQAYMDETGISQGSLSKRADISQAHLSMILSGERTPSLPLALKLARIANIPVETLIGKQHENVEA